jgi:N-acetylmuramoyl-L-alanine amidase
MEAGMRLEPAAAGRLDSDFLVECLALQLLALAGDQSVRTIEALASVLTNREHDGPIAAGGASSMDAPPAVCAPEAKASVHQEAEWTEASGKLPLCRRVARRAVHRSLLDPTAGANAFHRIDASPNWSKKSLPVATFGPFLFYRL